MSIMDDTPLDRRAKTIDILATEIERKNNTIKCWRKKGDAFKEEINELRFALDQAVGRIDELTANSKGLNGVYTKRKKNKKGMIDEKNKETDIF
jgi:hypothetical protein|tara:strand:+ start:250 stop:531 length:282 start_codon:yes stop_codon:yes gene_type:complete